MKSSVCSSLEHEYHHNPLPNPLAGLAHVLHSCLKLQQRPSAETTDMFHALDS
jgi:hypothetical protein